MAENASLQAQTAGNKKPLQGKVALLFEGASSDGRSMALSLAQNGADVALVYRPARAGLARETRDMVEAEGRRCLLIPFQDQVGPFARDAVRQTKTALGQPDIFIDYSSQSQ